jgi:hypothetical protein
MENWPRLKLILGISRQGTFITNTIPKKNQLFFDLS